MNTITVSAKTYDEAVTKAQIALQSTEEHLKILEDWLRSYHPEELFDEDGRLLSEIRALAHGYHFLQSCIPVSYAYLGFDCLSCIGKYQLIVINIFLAKQDVEDPGIIDIQRQ